MRVARAAATIRNQKLGDYTLKSARCVTFKGRKDTNSLIPKFMVVKRELPVLQQSHPPRSTDEVQLESSSQRRSSPKYGSIADNQVLRDRTKSCAMTIYTTIRFFLWPLSAIGQLSVEWLGVGCLCLLRTFDPLLRRDQPFLGCITGPSVESQVRNRIGCPALKQSFIPLTETV